MAAPTAMDASPAGGQGNVGFSGTPMWKIKQQMGDYATAKPAAPLPPTKEQLEKQKQLEELLVANVRFHATSLGGPATSAKAPADKAAAPKPFARHVLVKDLRKVAKMTKSPFPTTGLFADRSPVALFALFDGQSGAGEAGPNAAEWCCKNVHTKILKNLAELGPDQTDELFVKAALSLSFQDLDRDLLTGQTAIQDGCGACVALMVGEQLFTAVLGKCDAVLFGDSRVVGKPVKPAPAFSKAAQMSLVSGPGGAEAATQEKPSESGEASRVPTARPSKGPLARSMGSEQGRCDLQHEHSWLVEKGGEVLKTEGGKVCVRTSTGSVAAVSRSLGDRTWKSTESGGAATSAAAALLRSEPQISTVHLRYTDGNPALMFMSTPVAERIPMEELKDIVAEFSSKSRAISGEVVSKAAEAIGSSSDDLRQQCVAVTIYFLPPKAIPEHLAALAPGIAGAAGPMLPSGAHPVKKQKTGPGKGELESVRLRHILVRYRGCGHPVDPIRRTEVTRTDYEADTLLRRALREVLQEQAEIAKKPLKDPKKAAVAHLQPTPIVLALIKEISECESAKQGGNMRGDLGWLNPDALRLYGADFAEIAQTLKAGEWSDLVKSEHGVHVMQRVA